MAATSIDTRNGQNQINEQQAPTSKERKEGMWLYLHDLKPKSLR